ncbi:hypothetical protein [Flavobacterium sp.]|uniref:hypothetical protein n=1 Tax=Flavobacterium sp. TaxID=239 RepID=UPI00286E77BC|nr:hypothetical protein [Flavobacterium sp.]
MKNFLYTLVFCVSFFSFGQKIKEKKDQILFDDVAIANVEKDATSTIFKYNSINNANGIIVTFKTFKIDAQNSKSWLLVTNLDASKKTEVNFEFLSFSLNYKKAIAELLAKKYNIFTANGIENLDVFFDEKRPIISDEVEKLNVAKVSLQKDLANVNYFVFTPQKLIFSGTIPNDAFSSKYTEQQNNEFMSKVVGMYAISMKQDSSPYPVLNVDISSLSERILARAVDRGGKMVVALTESNATFVYTPTVRLDQNNSESVAKFVKELVEQTYMNGQKYITLMEAETLLAAKKEENKEKFAEAKKNSVNIYEKNGYAVDDKGEKLEGKLSIDFEKIVVNNSGIVDLDGVGKMATIIAKNEKGKLRFFNYKAKEGVYFSVINDDNTETIYRAVLVKIDANQPKDNSVLDLGSLSGLSLASASWKYFKEIIKTEKISILQDVVSKSFVIKVPNQEKGFQIFIRNGKLDKFITKLNEYLGNSVSSSDLEKIDYTNLDGLNNLVDLYSKK